MHQIRTIFIVSFASIASLFSSVVISGELNLMPYPQEVEKLVGSFKFSNGLTVYFEGVSLPRKKALLHRISNQASRHTGKPFTLKEVQHPKQASVVVQTTTGSLSRYPLLRDDESYQLTILPHKINLTADNEFGILQGISTLLQLMTSDKQSISLPALNITDAPRFPWRGLLIDSVRHFMPLETIKRQLDGMASAKLNVFHWHLTDDQSWRIEIDSYPKLHKQASNGFFYSKSEIKDIVSYASNLGIRVVPEFDLPGHASAIATVYPELMTDVKNYPFEYQWGVFEPLLDPSKAATYQFIDKVVAELSELFPDPYLHIGGDEVNPTQWEKSQAVNKLMLANNISGPQELQAFFNHKVNKILKKHDKRMMGWDEIFHPNLPQDIVIQSWRGKASLKKIANAKYQGLLSAGFYVDQPQSTSFHYSNDPLSFQEFETPIIDKSTTWSHWKLSMPRLKGSAVDFEVMLVENNRAEASAYLMFAGKEAVQINNLSIENKQVKFQLDTWMGPMQQLLDVSSPKNVTGKILIGNTFYSVSGHRIGSSRDGSSQVPQFDASNRLDSSLHSFILGGEATLWSELVTDKNIDLRLWPRLYAIAERLWSKTVTSDINNMYHRLRKISTYANNILLLQPNSQQQNGFMSLTNNRENIDPLIVLAESLEPAHYYTRHHLKFQKNRYHQKAELNKFADYLFVESDTLVQMKYRLRDATPANEAMLKEIEFRFLIWKKNLSLVDQLIRKHQKLSELKTVRDRVSIVTSIGLKVLSNCANGQLIDKDNSKRLKDRLYSVNWPQAEIVVSSAHLVDQLIDVCAT